MKRITLTVLLAASAMILAGCSTMTEEKIQAGAGWAESYYNAANVAEIMVVENDNTNQCAEIHIKNFTRFVLNTPVPPKSIIPREPTFFEGMWDTVKTVAPYAFMYGIVSEGVIGNNTSTSSTVNNAAPAVTP